MHNYKKVVWLVDVDDWCYAEKARNIAKRSAHIHFVIPTKNIEFDKIKKTIKDIDPDVIFGETIHSILRIPDSFLHKTKIIIDSKRQFKKQLKVVWLVDVKNWCFYSRAKNISKYSQHKIIIIPTLEKDGSEVMAEIEQINPNIIIGLSVAIFKKIRRNCDYKLIVGLTGGRYDRGKI